MSTTADENLQLLEEDLRRARAEREMQRSLRRVETTTAKQRDDEAVQERHEDMMSQLRTMRGLLSEQHKSQAQQREQMEQLMRSKQMSDVQAAVTSLRDERRAYSDHCAEKQAREKAEMEKVVLETREQLLSLADELQEDSARRHEQLRHILLANASARESVSLSELV
ncbi:hypothetical protein B0F90DRAFT_1700761 [Multifurca ochricompacta]|uniref:Uncharacterized protein n=1 Tax=Multifurca ochricompacta TaxID=376703 RepID=A0AAD4MAZ6_9AGAM|nr:hypothetical protein B0F90DRAFT_1700761 [Multifurca ochricompacta]